MAEITLGGYKFHLDRLADTPYQKSWRRLKFQDSQIRPTGRLAFTSRDDLPIFNHTSFSGGRTWWEPLYDDGNLTTFLDSNNMDTFTRPGRAIPLPKRNAASQALNITSPFFTKGTTVYAVGDSTTTDSTNLDIYKWTPASDDFVRDSGGTSGLTAGPILGAVYDPVTGYAYFMNKAYISRYNLSSTTNASWQAITANYGDTLMLTADGKIWAYAAGKFQELNTSGPSLTDVKDDGFGTDIISSDMASPTNVLFHENDVRLAFSAGTGVYYIKNSYANGQPICTLSRIERDQSGAYIRYQLFSLPPGTLGLCVMEHMGSVIVAATPDWQLALANDADANEVPVIDYWHYTPGSGPGVVGSTDRGLVPAEVPGKLIGSLSHYMVIGSQDRLWVYDARVGGIHPWLNGGSANTKGMLKDIAVATDSSGRQILLVKEDASTGYYKMNVVDPTTVAALDTDSTTYDLESNWFDFNRPFEDKRLVSVSIETEDMTGNNQYTIYVRADDDAGWTKVATHKNGNYARFDLAEVVADTSGDSAIYGKRFRYKVVFETTASSVYAFKGITFTANAGEMVPMWSLALNGTHVRNIENEQVDPAVVRANLEELAASLRPVTLVDRFINDDETDEVEQTVVIESADVIKRSQNEASLAVTLLGYR